MEQTDLGAVLNKIGRIGRYQIFVYALISIPLILSGVYSYSFVFTAGDLKYRCYIDGCDETGTSQYKTEWLTNAVPFEKDVPVQCYKFNVTNKSEQLECAAPDFDRDRRVKCNKFVYESNERTIVNDLGLTCDENKWKLAMVGTVHSAGHLLNLLITGYFSDKYGRRSVLIFSAIGAATFGIIRTFSWNYLSFTILEFIDAFLGAGVYTAGFILVLEIVKPEHRAMSGAFAFCAKSFGKVLLGISAMIFREWKTMLRVNLSFSYITILYFWLVPESFRWLMSKGRRREMAKTLLNIAKINKTEISYGLRDLLEHHPENLVLNTNQTNVAASSEYKFAVIFDYPKMLIRLVACSFCWMVIVFVFHGLSLMAVSIGGNKYTDYVLVQFIEIPAAILMPFISNKMGRRTILCGSFVIGGIALMAYPAVSDIYYMKLTLFLIGKFTMAVAYSNMFLYNSELFPTNLRHTLIGICSAFGRIGSGIAPQATLLNILFDNLAMYVFGVVAFLAGLVCLQLPETLNTQLPDTIEEALNIGKTNKILEPETLNSQLSETIEEALNIDKTV